MECIYNGQVYLCEQALASSPSPTLFTACYNDGRIAPLTWILISGQYLQQM